MPEAGWGQVVFFDAGYMQTGWMKWEQSITVLNGDMQVNCMTPDNYLGW